MQLTLNQFVSDSEYVRLLLIQTSLSYELNLEPKNPHIEDCTFAGIIEMTTQRSVEKHSVLSNRERESRIHERTERFNNLLLDAVDETLKEVFKEAGAEVIYHFLGNKCHLKREEIGEKPEDFSAGLERLLVSAAPMIEKLILRSFCSKLRLEFEEKEAYRLSDYLKELREKCRC